MKYAEGIEKLIRDFCAGKRAEAKTTMELDEKIIADSIVAQNKSETVQSAALQPNVWRIIMHNRTIKYAAAVMILIVIIIGFIEVGKPVGASTVFAAAMDNVRQARTFSCTTIFEATYEDNGNDGKYLMKQKSTFKEPDWERHEKLTSPWPRYIGETTISDYGIRQELTLRPVEKTAQLSDMSSDYTIDKKTGELKLRQLNTRLRDYLLDVSAEAVEDLGNVELDGQSVRILQSRKDKRITTVWVNPETNYPVQIEHQWTDQSRSPVMYTSIQIDAGLDDNLFSLEPPEDYTLSVEEPGWPDYKKKMMTKVMHLGLWCVNYASDNDDQFPGELADLVKSGVITDEVLSKVLAAPDDPDGPPAIRYRKPNTADKDWSTEVTLYEIYDQWPNDGAVVCFADGHCELIGDQNRFEELIK